MAIQLADGTGNPVFADVVLQAQLLSTLNAAVSLQLRGQASACFYVAGIAGPPTLSFEGSIDGANFFAVNAYPLAGGAAVTTITGNGGWSVNCAGMYIVRLRISTLNGGFATVSGIASQGVGVQPIAVAGTLTDNITQWASTNLGIPTNFGTTPGAVVAASVNSSVFIGTTVAVAAAAGIQKVGISGNAGASVDAVSGAAVPANALMVAGGSVAGGTNLTVLTVKAASTAAAATDTSLVVQALVGNAVMSTAAAGVQKVGIVGNTGATLDAASGSAAPTNGQLVGGGSVAGGTNFTALTVKAASTAAAATDTSLVVQPLVGNNVQRTNQTTTAAGVVDVNLVGSLGVTNSATNGSFVRATDNTTAVTAAIAALGTAPTGTAVEAVNNVALPNASAGAACTLFQNSAVTTAVVVKASAGNVYGCIVSGGTSGQFLQFINASSAPTLGTAAVVSFPIPASGQILIPSGALAMFNNATGISVGISTTYNGAVAGASTAVVVLYK